ECPHVDPFDVTLRRLTVRDTRYLQGLAASSPDNLEASGLDARSHALVRIAALIALGAGVQSYAGCVDAARAAGATDEEIAGTLVATLPLLGEARVITEAPKLGLALGYDVEGALEAPDPIATPAGPPQATARGVDTDTTRV
ncbi:MAG: carboxymuconolactone decarboxylase family protein, partial [Gaiella sp.]